MKNKKFYTTEEFKKLQKEWYEILKKDGFNDCENVSRFGLILAQYCYYPFRHLIKGNNFFKVKIRQEYYLKINECFEKEIFKSHRDYLVMFYCSQGLNRTEIKAKLLEYGISLHVQTIRYIVRRYENKWKIRSWREDQMKSQVIAS